MVLVFASQIVGVWASPAVAKIDWEKCGEVYDDVFESAKRSRNALMVTINLGGLVPTTSGASSSSSSYASSTGKCKGTAQRERERRRFVATSSGALEAQVAQGQGEYVDALAYLHGCDRSAPLGEALRANFGIVFRGDDPSANAEAIKAVIASDAQLASHCEI